MERQQQELAMSLSKTRYEIRVERITASTLEELAAKVEAVELKEGEQACSYELFIPVLSELKQSV